jgi:hypothetical protein
MRRHEMPFIDQGKAFYKSQHRELQINYLKREAANLGFQIIGNRDSSDLRFGVGPEMLLERPNSSLRNQALKLLETNKIPTAIEFGMVPDLLIRDLQAENFLVEVLSMKTAYL